MLYTQMLLNTEIRFLIFWFSSICILEHFCHKWTIVTFNEFQRFCLKHYWCNQHKSVGAHIQYTVKKPIFITGSGCKSELWCDISTHGLTVYPSYICLERSCYCLSFRRRGNSFRNHGSLSLILLVGQLWGRVVRVDIRRSLVPAESNTI